MTESTHIFLSREEVATLTGARITRKQIKVLRREAIRHTIDAAGWPVVPRVAVEGRDGSAAAPKVRKEWQPRKAA